MEFLRAALSAAVAVTAFAAFAADYPAPKEGDWIARDFKFHLIPASTETPGHLTTGNARSYAQPLQELLQTAPQRTMQVTRR